MEDDSGRESSDGESAKEVEDELYSVIHHNDFSQGIPEHLLEKYNISYNSDNELEISFKNGESGLKSGNPAQVSMGPTPDAQDDLLVSKSSSKSQESLKTEDEIESKNSDSEDVILIEKKHDLIALSSDSDDIAPKRPALNIDSDVEIVNVSKKSDDSDVQIINVSSAKKKKKKKKKQSLDFKYFWDPSDDELDSSLLVNFSRNYEKPIDVNVSDVVNSNVDWKDVVSPKSWTEAMRRFYNKPDHALRKFDHYQILREIRQDKQANWDVNNDEFSYRRPVRRCRFCRQMDHLYESCPKRFSNCSMCGNEGHNCHNCPNRMCLNCGAKNYVFVERCGRCSFQAQRQCRRCERIGHEERLCPDNWRQYSNLHGHANNETNPRVYCCNCGSQGHLDDECPLGYTNPFPASSLLVDKRVRKKDRPNRFGQNKKPYGNSPTFPIPKKKNSPRKRANSHSSHKNRIEVMSLNVGKKKKNRHRNRLNNTA